MTKEDVIRMAREAGVIPDSQYLVPYDYQLQALESFAAIVASAEREACAQVCSKVIDDRRREGNTIGYNAIMQCAESIRARSRQ